MLVPAASLLKISPSPPPLFSWWLCALAYIQSFLVPVFVSVLTDRFDLLSSLAPLYAIGQVCSVHVSCVVVPSKARIPTCLLPVQVPREVTPPRVA